VGVISERMSLVVILSEDRFSISHCSNSSSSSERHDCDSSISILETCRGM